MNEDGSTVIETSTPTDQSVALNNANNVTTTTDDSVANVATNIEVSNDNNLSETPSVTDATSTVPQAPTTVQPTPTVQDILPDNATLDQAIMGAVVNENRFQNIANNNGQSMDNFLNSEYDYDRNEAGTYWVAGAINDNNTQMSFLNTIINEEMYDTLDLQKYYYDTQLGVARAYAAQKNFESAYGFYRAAQQKAIAEGQLTGWYMPAEGRYLLNQYEIADDVLNDSKATAEEKFKAQNVRNTAEKWFAANKITTRGIKCLGMLEYEETKRHNEVMGKLKEQYNKIQMSSAGAGGASAYWQGKLYDFSIMGGELEIGMDLNGDSIVGYTDEMRKYINKGNGLGSENWLSSYTNLEDELQNGLTTQQKDLFGYWGESLRSLIGEDKYKTFNTEYQKETGAKMNQSEYDANGFVGKPTETKNTISNEMASKLGDEKLAGKKLFTRYDKDGLHIWAGTSQDDLGEEITTKLTDEMLDLTINDKSAIKYSDIFYGLASDDFQYPFQNKQTEISSEFIGSSIWKEETTNDVKAFLNEHPDAKVFSGMSIEGINEGVVIQVGEGDNAKYYELDLDEFGNIEKTEDGKPLSFKNGLNEVSDPNKIQVADFSSVKVGENLFETSGYFKNLGDDSYRAKWKQHSYLKTMINDGAANETITTDGSHGYMYKANGDGTYEIVNSLTDSNGKIIYFTKNGDVISSKDVVVFDTQMELKGSNLYGDNKKWMSGINKTVKVKLKEYGNKVTGSVPENLTQERGNLTKSTEVLDENISEPENNANNNNEKKTTTYTQSGGGGGGNGASGDSNLESPNWNSSTRYTSTKDNKKNDEEEPEVINEIYKSKLAFQFQNYEGNAINNIGGVVNG